jgi:hypothetical protein
MKSWKKERYRRQKLFIETKKRRRLARDTKLLSNEMIKSWADSVRMFLWKEKEPK